MGQGGREGRKAGGRERERERERVAGQRRAEHMHCRLH